MRFKFTSRFKFTLMIIMTLVMYQHAFAYRQLDFDNIDPREQHKMLGDMKRLQYEKSVFLAGDRAEKTMIGEDYDALYYKLNINVDHIGETIDGNTVIAGVALENDFHTVVVDFLDNMNIDSLKSLGQHLGYTHANDLIEIELPETLSVGGSFFVNVFYNGSPQSSGWGSFGFDYHSTGPIIWTLSEPYAARNWWPCKDIPWDKADSVDIWITCDSTLVATSEGTLREVLNNGNGTTTYKWHESYPISTYLVSMAISNYVTFNDWYHTAGGDSMEVRYWVFPQDSANAEIDFSVTVPMMEVFVDRYNIEYPFVNEKYGHSAFPWGGAMEHQTNTSYGAPLIRGDHRYDGIVAHELAHQWWGDLVTCWEFIDIWLNEGFAVYGEAIWWEDQGGPEGLRDYMLDIDVSSGNFPGSIYDPDDTFNSTVYDKGGWANHMLRHVVGDSTFFAILHEWGTNPSSAYAAATTQDFHDVCEDISGMELDWFFDEWIYGENRPVYRYWWTKSEDQGDWTVQLHIDQTQVNADPFKMPIDIELEFVSGETTFVVWDSLASQDFYLTVSDEPTGLNFDPWAWVLKRVTEIPAGVSEGDIPGGSPIPMVSSLSQNHPNPFNPTTTISYTVGASAESGEEPIPVQLRIFDARGKLVVTLVDNMQKPGTYEASWDGRNRQGAITASGIYFYLLESGDFRATRKMVLLK